VKDFVPKIPNEITLAGTRVLRPQISPPIEPNPIGHIGINRPIRPPYKPI
jgi:hypothetical protein